VSGDFRNKKGSELLSKRKTNYKQVRQVFACFSYNSPKKAFKSFDKENLKLIPSIIASLFTKLKIMRQKAA
jgi:hypothetical protein